MSTKRLLSFLCVVAVAVSIARTIPAEPPATESKAASTQEQPLTREEAAKRVEALLKERRDTLRQMVEHVEAQVGAGQSTTVSLLRAKNSLLDAELDLAKTRDELVAVREKIVANLKMLEKIAEYNWRHSAVGDVETYFQAKAARLKAEADLLREKIGGEK